MDLENAPFVFDRCIGGLGQQPAEGTVSFRGSVAVGFSGRLVVSGVDANPSNQVFCRRKYLRGGTDLSDDLLCRINPQPWHFGQPMDGLLVRFHELRQMLIEFRDMLIQQAQFLQQYA